MSCARRQVTLEEANAKATELNIMFMETSAKAGHNVKSLFKKIAMSLVGMEKEGEAAETQNASECQRVRGPCLIRALNARLPFSQKSTLLHRHRTKCRMLHNVSVDDLHASPPSPSRTALSRHDRPTFPPPLSFSLCCVYHPRPYGVTSSLLVSF